MSSEDTIAKAREQEFGSLEGLYFNAAYMGPCPRRSQERIRAALDQSANPRFMDYSWIGFTDTIRSQISKLLNCNAENLSLNSSTSEAVSAAAFGLGLKAGDSIAILEGEYPSDVLPWMLVAERTGVQIQFLKAESARDPDVLVKSLRPNTKVFGISHVCFQTGSIVDLVALGKVLKEREILFLADITQSFGGMPLPPQALPFIDIMPCSVYKWVLAPYGQAFCYWSDRALKQVQATQFSWLAMAHSPSDLTRYTTKTKGGARKLDRGQSPNILGLSGLEGSLELLSELGLEAIYRHNQTLVRHFLSHYPQKKYRLLTQGTGSNIVCLQAQGGQSAAALQSILRTAGIDVSVREGNLRISFHLFNTLAEVEVLLKTI